MTRFIFILSTFIFSLPLLVNGQQFYIDANASGNGDGTSWENAFKNFPDAFANYPADAIFWVAEGVYHVTNSTNFMEKITLDEPVSIYGGFIGNESSLEERAWYNHPCFVSGNIGDPNSQTDNSRGFFDVDNENTLIDGLIFQDTYQTSSADALFYSPIRSLPNSKLTIVNCIFRYNTAWSCSGIRLNGLVNIENSLFHDNTNLGGGHNVTLNIEGEAYIRNCTFANNQWETSFGSEVGGNNNAHAFIFNTIIKNTSTNPIFSAPIIQANNSVIFGNAVSQTVVNNSSNLSTEEPTFINPGNADFRLTDSSPGVNWGNNGQIGEYYLDLAGAPRIRGGIVDAGAYETAVEPSDECVGDLDQNGAVDANDLLLLLTEFGCQSNCTHDLNNSGSVDTNDLLIFLSVFGQPC